MLCGIGFIGVIAAAIAAYFVGESGATKNKKGEFEVSGMAMGLETLASGGTLAIEGM